MSTLTTLAASRTRLTRQDQDRAGRGRRHVRRELRLRRLRHGVRPLLRQRLLPRPRPRRRHASGLRHAGRRLPDAAHRRRVGGYLGDQYGRKPVLVGALLTMGIATVLIGCCPPTPRSASSHPILLVTIRVIQGLAFGAEWGGAVMMTYEHAPWRHRGRFAAIPQAGNPLGIALANIAFLLSASLDGDWAWRLPFLASAMLIVVGLVVRMKLNESPEFEEAKATGDRAQPAAHRDPDDWRNILRVIALRIVESCAYYLTATYLLSYITKHNPDDRAVALAGVVVASLLAVGTTLCRRTDRPRRPPPRLPRRLPARHRLRHPDVPADQHRPAVPDRAGVPDRHRRHPRRADGHSGRLVRGAVQDRAPGPRARRSATRSPRRWPASRRSSPCCSPTPSAGGGRACSTSSSGSSAWQE